MSERGSLESEEKIESRPLEETKESVESRALEDATHEPKARVEQTGSAEQSEAIEVAITELVGPDTKVSQTDPPKISEGELKPAKKEAEGGDPATPIILSTPEVRPGKEGEKTEPDPQGTEIWVADEPKAEVGENERDESEIPDSTDATPIPLPGKETPVTSSQSESQRLEESDSASLPPQRLDKELPESKRQGKQKETDLADGSEFTGVTISGIEGLPESDPFSEGGIPPDAGEESHDFGDIMPDFNEAIQAAQMEREPFDPGRIGGGPGSIHPKYGPSGSGMIGDDPDKTGTTEEEKKSEHTFEADSVYKTGSKKAVAQAEMEALEAAKNLDNAKDAYIAGTGTEGAVNEAQENLNAANWLLREQYLTADEMKYGTKAKMPRPDGDDEGVDAPQREDDVKHEDMVVDPASTMGTVRSSGVDRRKHPGVVSDPAEWQDPDTPETDVKTDLDLAKDPPEEGAGTESTNRKS